MLLVPIIEVLQFALQLYSWIVIISVVMSWLVQFGVINTHNRAVYMIGSSVNQMVEPALRLIRRYVPLFGNVDVSPIILLFAIYIAQRYLGFLAVRLLGN